MGDERFPMKLNSGYTMPGMGAGTWPFLDDEAQAAVETAIDVGFRMIDTAARYENETHVGRGISASGVPRSELFVTSKLRGSNQEAGDARRALETSLSKLGLDHLDLYLIHFPVPRIDRYVETFRQMVALRDEGLTRSIGVSNFLEGHLARIDAEVGVTPAANQIELDPTRARIASRASNDRRGILTQTWSPLGRGGPVLDDPAVLEIAAARGITPGQAILLWHRTLDLVPIVRTANRGRLSDNVAVLDMEPLNDAELSRMATLDQGDANVLDSETYEEF